MSINERFVDWQKYVFVDGCRLREDRRELPACLLLQCSMRRSIFSH